MGAEEHKEIFLKDYKSYDYSITHTRLTFDLGEETTTCTSKLACARAYDGAEVTPVPTLPPFPTAPAQRPGF